MFSWEQALTSLLLIKLLSRYLAVTLLTYFYFLPRSFSHLFRSSTICYFNLVPRVLFYPSLRSERGRETLVGSGHVSPSPKLIVREENFVSQFFVCFLSVTILLFQASVFTVLVMIVRASWIC